MKKSETSPNSNAKTEHPTGGRDLDGNDLKFYGRRKGKKMRDQRLGAYDSIYPLVGVSLPESGDIDPRSFFDAPVKDVWLEIGFGNGEHLVHQALQNPDIGMIGCEPFLNGIAALCSDIKAHNIKNIRIFGDDARLLLPKFKDNSFGRAFVLNSDPWPKKRHAKRRFIQQGTLDELHRLLHDGAQLRLSSDHPVLIDWQLHQTYFHAGFDWQATCKKDWADRPSDLPETRYQKKGVREGRGTVFLDFLTRESPNKER